LRKKLPRLLFWLAAPFIALFVVFVLIVASLAIRDILKKPPQQDLTQKQWKDHRKTLVLYQQTILGELGDPWKMYATATGALNEKWVQNCMVEGCFDFRAFLKEVVHSTGDGNVTPEKISAIMERSVFLNAALKRGDERYLASGKNK
jgi:hypothetical protein